MVELIKSILLTKLNQKRCTKLLIQHIFFRNRLLSIKTRGLNILK